MTARGAVRSGHPMARPIDPDRGLNAPVARPANAPGSLAHALRPLTRALGPILGPTFAPALGQILAPLVHRASPLLIRRRLGGAILVGAIALTALLGGLGLVRGGTTNASAADALAGTGTAPASLPATLPAAASDTGAGFSSLPGLLGGDAGPNALDLVGKGLIVLALLYVTLRVLRRVQGGPSAAGAHLSVIESRTLAAKASLHLVAVGDRRLVVGLTPAGMVALAELDAHDLRPAAAFSAELARIDRAPELS